MDTNPITGVPNNDPVAAMQSFLDSENAPPEPEQQEVVEEQEEPIEAEAEPESEEPEQGEPDEDGLDDVEYEGNQYRLPKELKEALLRQQDYTRKTQEVAEQRRIVEVQQERVKAEEASIRAQAEFNQIAMQDMAEIHAAANTIKQFDQVNWMALSDSDPVQAQKLYFQYQQSVDRHNKLTQGLQQKYQQFSQQQQQQRIEALNKGMELLKKDIPNWGAEKQRELKDAGKNYGFTDAELGNIYDPRFVKILADAAAYRKLQAAKPQQNKRVPPNVKTVQPGAKTINKQAQAQRVKDATANLRKSGKVEDAAAVFLARMK